MAYRFSNTEKWQDSWFSELSQIEMLLFIYLCDNCDIAGFIEVNYKRWASDLNSSKETIQGACKGLARGLIYSTSEDCIFLRNFLKHQKNLPLNSNNKAHLGIIKRFELYKQKFDFEDIDKFIEGGSKGLQSPTGIGNGIGIGIGKEEKDPEKNKIPDISEFKNFILENEPSCTGKGIELKYKSWIENGWKDGNGKPIKNWKSKALNIIPYLQKKLQNGNNEQKQEKYNNGAFDNVKIH